MSDVDELRAAALEDEQPNGAVPAPTPVTADLIRGRLAHLRELDAHAAETVDELWPETLAVLDQPLDTIVPGLPFARPLSFMLLILADELEDALAGAMARAELDGLLVVREAERITGRAA